MRVLCRGTQMDASNDPPDYRRVPVEEALRVQAGQVIAAMRTRHPALASVSDPELLRYCISFQDDAEAAGAAAHKALQFRSDNASWLEPARRLVEEGRPLSEVYKSAPSWDVLAPRLVSGTHRTTVFGGPVAYIRAGLIDLDELMNVVDVKEMARFFVYDKEVVYTMCKMATQHSGFVTKASFFTCRLLFVLTLWCIRRCTLWTERISESRTPTANSLQQWASRPRLASFCILSWCNDSAWSTPARPSKLCSRWRRCF